MLKYLRIAVTALSLTACVLLIVLWVRSYSYRVVVALGVDKGPGYAVESVKGSVTLFYLRWSHGYFTKGWDVFSEAPDFRLAQRFQLLKCGAFAFKSSLPGLFVIVVPHWFPIAGFAALTAAPWISWSNRFSLRTLLIATTPVAVVLGVVVLMA